jgi:predicted DNA-binding transcriptional regulator AlpA
MQTNDYLDVSDSVLLRPPLAAAFLGLSVSTLAKLRLRGDGPPYCKLGPRAVGYRRADLDAWLTERTRRSTSDSRRGTAP